jgi:hypothetical protein
VNSTVILSVSSIFSSEFISFLDSQAGFDICVFETADVSPSQSRLADRHFFK